MAAERHNSNKANLYCFLSEPETIKFQRPRNERDITAIFAVVILGYPIFAATFMVSGFVFIPLHSSNIGLAKKKGSLSF